MKKPFWKKWWVWVIAIILLFVIFGGGNDKDSKNDPNKPQVVSKEPAKKEEKKVEKTPEKTVFNVGEAIQLGDNKLTVTKVEKSKGSDFDTPKSGKEFVIVHVKIENAGKENISYNPYDFKMSNSQGQVTDMALSTVNTDTALDSGDLAPGGKVEGSIVFEEPVNDSALQLQYSVSFWSNKLIKVNIK